MEGKKYSFNIGLFSIFVVGAELVFWLILFLMYSYVQENEPSFRFEHSWVLYVGLVLIPLLIFAHFYLKFWRNRSLKRYAEYKLLPHLFTGYSTWKSGIKYVLLRFGLSCLIVAGANPQYGETEKEIQTKGIDIMIALDVSTSMLAEDLVEGKSRLYVAKKGVSQLIDRLHGDHIGIVVFAGAAYKQLPITPDYNIAKMFLNNISTDMMSSQGTDIGNAIDECLSSFDFEKETNKVIIVFSDGEDHEESALIGAKEAKEKGVIVHTIGMGTTVGSPIPMGKKGVYKKDENGERVMTKLNENMMIDVADAGGGSYIRAQGYSIGLDGLIGDINEIEKATLKTDKYLTYSDHFQIFLLIGLLLIGLDLFLTEKKASLLSQITNAKSKTT